MKKLFAAMALGTALLGTQAHADDATPGTTSVNTDEKTISWDFPATPETGNYTSTQTLNCQSGWVFYHDSKGTSLSRDLKTMDEKVRDKLLTNTRETCRKNGLTPGY